MLVQDKTAAENVDRKEERKILFAALKAATTESLARQVESEIWKFWLKGPDALSTKLVADAMAARRKYEYESALNLLNSAIKRSPNFAEAWNQRAFVYFLQNDLERSLTDLEHVLELEPKHFGAMSGQFHIFMRQGRVILAQSVLKKAVDIHPWIQERKLLPN